MAKANETNRAYITQDELKQVELDLLSAFDAYARAGGLRYSLAYGTLIGAVRHGGFIPWDDDIDVVVPRPDYDKLVEVGRAGELVGGYKLTGYAVDGFPMPFLKLIDTSYRAEAHSTRKDIPLSPWIDIFPLDGVGGTLSDYEKLDKELYFCKNLVKTSFYRFIGAGKTLPKRLAKMVVMPFTRAFGLGDWAERRLAKLAASGPSYDEAEWVSNVVWGVYRMGERIPKAWLSSVVDMKFEGRTFLAMEGWDAYLTSLYGDYMTPPPEGGRAAHGLVAWREPSDE